MSQQPAFAQKPIKNSLRCMPGADNGSLGSKLGGFATKTNKMNRDDTLRVDFFTKIGTVDPLLVPFCVRQGAIQCDQIGPDDRIQFTMTEKAVGGGKISSPYDDPNQGANDNKYKITRTVRGPISHTLIAASDVSRPTKMNRCEDISLGIIDQRHTRLFTPCDWPVIVPGTSQDIDPIVVATSPQASRSPDKFPDT